jgi:hypothetical protein
MKQRCLNPNTSKYEFYGGRGIKICDRWLVFVNFLEDMGERPGKEYSIEREDSNGNYEPGNCRWATRSEQVSNTRFNRHITIDGETKTLSEWCRHYKVPFSRVNTRLNLGWTVPEAFTAPSDKSALRSTRQRIPENIRGSHEKVEKWVEGVIHPRTVRKHKKEGLV